ncbi:hypothetical protein BH10PSE6_BH10PSE6_30630 [soil metagenome]
MNVATSSRLETTRRPERREGPHAGNGLGVRSARSFAALRTTGVVLLALLLALPAKEFSIVIALLNEGDKS